MAKIRFKIKCDWCAQSLKVNESRLGKDIHCPTCGQEFKAPPASQLKAMAEHAPTNSLNRDMTQDVGQWADDFVERAAADFLNDPVNRIGRFEIRRELGQGGFGRVYEAYDPQLARKVALKVPTFDTENPRRLRRFTTEARSAARLHHPNIVAVFENGQTECGHLYIASEYVAGKTLKRYLGSDDATLSQKVTWIRDLAEALAYAHSEGIIHRDIKPENVLIEDVHKRARIVDFGLAKVLDDSVDDAEFPLKTQDGVIGTPAFMAPEQARGELDKLGPLSDQYSLGAVLYQCLTGQTPFQGSVYVIIAAVSGDEEPPPVQSVAQGIPKDLIAICEKAMSKAQQNRYEDLSELAADLERWLRDEPVLARRTSPLRKFARLCRRNPAISGMTSVTIVILCLAIIILNGALQSVEKEKQNADQSRILAEQASEEARFHANAAIQKADEAAIAQANAIEAKLEAEQQREQTQSALDELRREKSRADTAESDVATKSQEATELSARLESRRNAGEYPLLLHKVNTLQEEGQFAEALTAIRGIPNDIRGWEWHVLYNSLISTSARQIAVPSASTADSNGLRSPVSHGRAAFHPTKPLMAFADEKGLRLIDFENISQPLVETQIETAVKNVRSLSFNGQGSLLCGVTLDGNCFLWDTKSWHRVLQKTLNNWPMNLEKNCSVQIQLSQNHPYLYVILGEDFKGRGNWRVNTYHLREDNIDYIDTINSSVNFTMVPFLLPNVQANDYRAIAGFPDRLLTWAGNTKVGIPTSIPLPFSLKRLRTDIGDVPATSRFGYFGTDLGEIVAVDLQKGSTYKEIHAHEGEITFVHCASSGSLVATSGADGAVRIWSRPDLILKKTFLTHSGPVSWVKMAPNGEVAVSEAGETLLWRTGEEFPNSSLNLRPAITTLLKNPDANLSFQNFLRDQENNRLVVSVEEKIANRLPRKLVAFLPLGSPSNPGVASIRGIQEKIDGVVFAGSMAKAFFSAGTTAGLIDLRSNTVSTVPFSTLLKASGNYRQTAIGISSIGGDWLATVETDRKAKKHPRIVLVTNVVDEAEICKSAEVSGYDVQIIASCDGKFMAYSSDNSNSKGEVTIVEVSTGKVVRNVRISGRLYYLSAEAENLVLVDANRVNITSFLPDHTESSITLTGHTSPITAIRFASSEDRVITSSLDGTVRVWGLSSGIELAKLVTQQEGIVAIDLSADIRTLTTMTASGIVLTFKVGDQWNAPAAPIEP